MAIVNAVDIHKIDGIMNICADIVRYKMCSLHLTTPWLTRWLQCEQILKGKVMWWKCVKIHSIFLESIAHPCITALSCYCLCYWQKKLFEQYHVNIRFDDCILYIIMYNSILNDCFFQLFYLTRLLWYCSQRWLMWVGWNTPKCHGFSLYTPWEFGSCHSLLRKQKHPGPR